MAEFELDPKKPRWLAEVERDAVRIQTKRFNEQFEEQAYQAKLKTEEKAVNEQKGAK